MSQARGPLAGTTVVDVTSTLMGPFCSLTLAQLGARVIKIEQPEGDIVRYIGDTAGVGLGPTFLNANRGKESVVLDLKSADGRRALDALIDGADVFLHNMRPAAMRRLRIDAGTVLERNPRVVYCHTVGYGSHGPYRDKPAYDDVVQAVSGVAAVQGGSADPAYVRMPMADKTVGLMGATAVLAALVERGSTGRGQVVEVPMYESMAAFTLVEQQGERVFAGRSGGTGYPRTASPYRKPYRTSDGTIAVMFYTDAQWQVFFRMVGRPDLAADERLTTIRGRTENIDELYRLVEEYLTTRSTAEWLALFEREQIPAMPVNTLEDLFEDEHLAAVGFFEHVTHPVQGPLVQARLPWSFSGSPLPHLSPAPSLGESTRTVLLAAGLTEEEVAAAGGAGAHGSPGGSAAPA